MKKQWSMAKKKEDNLTPFKKGESGNPNGRPKGSRNRSTIIKEWLETMEIVTNPITGEKEQLEQQDIMTLALIKKARKGDVQAYKELMDGSHGMKVAKVDHTTQGEKLNDKPFEVKIIPPEED